MKTKDKRAGNTSAIPGMPAMVPAHITGDGNTQYDNPLPSRPASGGRMTDMGGIADHDRALLPEIDPGRPKRSKTGGRQKGTPNRVTRDIRAALRALAENNEAYVQSWLDRVAAEDPAEAMRLYLALLRFVTPTLQAAAIADITPRKSSEQAANLSDEDLLAIIHGAQPALPEPEFNPTDEELLR